MFSSTLSTINRILKVTLNLELYALSYPFEDCSHFDYELRKTLYENFQYDTFIGNFFMKMEPNTVYALTDNFESHYAFFPIPGEDHRIAVLGPYIIDEPNGEFIAKIIEKNQLISSMKFPLQNYFHCLPLVDSQTVISTLNEIASILYGGNDRYLVMFYNEDWNNIDIKSTLLLPNNELNLNIQLLEERYATENALLTSISKGDRRSAITHFHHFSSYALGIRTADPIRNTKNFALSLNTLYRKAAEQSYVHPVYLDDISRLFSTQIEQLQSVIKLNNLMLEMTRKYCILVKNQALHGSSPLVRKCINHINLNLSSPLSLKTLADAFSVNASYLSTMFKKEMGISLTEYINTQRIDTSIELLNTTDLNIQSIAWHVGMNDVNYFSRIFKKHIGVSPREYRNRLLQH